LSEPKSLSQSEEHSSKSEEFLEELKRREKEGIVQYHTFQFTY
jgi:hypothetical protein